MLKRLFRSYMSIRGRNTTRIIVYKTLAYEYLAILKKRSIWNRVKWTKAEQRAFDEYWSGIYGKKIPNWWHRLYESINGIHRIDYIPDNLYCSVIEPRLNDYSYCQALEDKTFGPWILPQINEAGLVCPRLFCACSGGRYYGLNHESITLEEAHRIVSNCGNAVLKIAVGSSSGRDIQMLNMKDGFDVPTGRKTSEVFASVRGLDWIIQERIVEHPVFAKLHPQSVNTIRVVTYIVDGKVKHSPLIMRIGTSGSSFDNGHAGGISIEVSDDGCLGATGYRLRNVDSDEKFTAHPDTGVQFSGYKLPNIPELVGTAEKMHSYLPHIGIISWDLTVNDCDEIVLIEINLKGQSPWFQIAYGKPLFGADSAAVIRSVLSNYR